MCFDHDGPSAYHETTRRVRECTVPDALSRMQSVTVCEYWP